MLDKVSSGRAVVNEIVLGVVRRYRALNWVLDQVARRAPQQNVSALLLVGLYQLLFMTNVEPFAVVHEAVQLAKEKFDEKVAGFVNAVLRRVAREKETWLAALDQQPAGIRLSHPDLLLRRWGRQYGAEHAEALCEWNNQTPSVMITIARSRTSLDAVANQLRVFGLEVVPAEGAPERSLVLPRGARVAGLPGYEEGLFFVQDPSGQVAVDLLSPEPGHDVLDACAAPGGKTMLIADAMSDRGRIFAVERQERRMARLQQNVSRMKWGSVQVVQADAERTDSLASAIPDLAFDRVLLDVPCTNTGVIRRRPDVRWRFSLDRMQALIETQQRLLSAASKRLKPGGRLVYSTCSLEPEEGSVLVANWVERHTDFRLVEERHLFPPDSGTDGAYAAALYRTS